MSKTAKICYADTIARYHLPAAGLSCACSVADDNTKKLACLFTAKPVLGRSLFFFFFSKTGL